MEDSLVDEGITVDRLAGTTRIETAIAVADAAGVDADVLLARSHAAGDDPSQAFADSLATGGWASGNELPIYLTQTDRLTDSTASAFTTTQPDRTMVIGGTAAIADTVVEAITDSGMSADRIHGSTRFATATAVAEARGFTADAPADRIVVVEGQAGSAWVAGFTAAALSGQLDAPIVLVNGDTVPDETSAFLADAFVPTDGPVPVTCVASAEACEAVARLVGFGS